MIISLAFPVVVLLSFFMASSFESSSNFPMDFKGFVTPLIHITSPEHPLYDPNSTRDDRIRENIRISEDRERYLGLKSLKVPIDNASPIGSDFVVAFEMGTPPVKSYALLDTGSDVIWQKCKPCFGCSAKTPIFDPSESRSFGLLPCDSKFCTKRYGFSCAPKKSSCQYSITYADGTTTHGVVGKDSFRLVGVPFQPGELIPNAIFGCASEVKSQDMDNIGGIIGLRNTSISLPNQLHLHSTFSYCKGKFGTGGFFILGKDAALVGDKTPLFTDKYGYYQIIVEGITVGGYKLILPHYTFKYDEKKLYTGVTVDSGSSFTRLHRAAYDGLIIEIKQLMRGHQAYKFEDSFQWCYNATTDISIERMPSIHFHLGNHVILALPNENIWIKYDKFICLQILEAQQDWTILGAEQLNSYNVGFDLPGNLLWLSYNPRYCPY